MPRIEDPPPNYARGRKIVGKLGLPADRDQVTLSPSTEAAGLIALRHQRAGDRADRSVCGAATASSTTSAMDIVQLQCVVSLAASPAERTLITDVHLHAGGAIHR